jgi:hypothetical protein
MRNSRRHDGDSPAYQFRIRWCQAMGGSVARVPGRGKPRGTAILSGT